MRPHGRVLLFAALLALVPAVAHAKPADAKSDAAVAADRAEAKAAYEEGRRYVEGKDYRSAIASFKRAFLAYEDPLLLFNIAQCYRIVGDKPEAAHYYREFLAREPEPSNLAEIQAWLAKLDADIAAEHAEQTRPVPEGVEPPARSVDEEPPAPVPVYKKWWLWTIVSVAVVGGALGLGLGLGLRGPPVFHPTQPDFGPGATMKTTSGLWELRF